MGPGRLPRHQAIWPLVGLCAWLGAPLDPLAVHRIWRWVCRGAKDTPSPVGTSKRFANQSLLDSGISRPTTLASLAIRSDGVSSDCGKYLSFSSFCLRSDSK